MSELAALLVYFVSCWAFYLAGKSEGKVTKIEFWVADPNREYFVESDGNGNIFIERASERGGRQ
jgi:hypothetical protein